MIRSRHAALLSLCFFAASAQQRDPKPTLAKLDASSKSFINLQADIEQGNYTRLVRKTDTETGKVYSIKGKTGSEVGIKLGSRTALYKNGVIKDYTAGLACYNVYSQTQNKGTIDTVLTLAFGTSGKDLDDKWQVTDLGPDSLTVDGKSTPVEKLDLVPKDQGLRNNVSKIHLWIELDKAISPHLVIDSPSGDTKTVTYSNIRLNAKDVDKGPFEIKGKPCK